MKITLAHYFKLIFVILLFVSCSGAEGENISCNDHGRIYSVILDTVEQSMQKSTSSYEEVAVLDSTQTFRFNEYPTTPDSAYIIKKLPELKSITFRYFLEKNTQRSSLAERLNLNNLPPCDRDDPDARCLQLSDIGFEESCNQALLSYTYICGHGSKCGYEKFVLLEKKNNEWIIQNEFTSYEI